MVDNYLRSDILALEASRIILRYIFGVLEKSSLSLVFNNLYLVQSASQLVVLFSTSQGKKRHHYRTPQCPVDSVEWNHHEDLCSTVAPHGRCEYICLPFGCSILLLLEPIHFRVQRSMKLTEFAILNRSLSGLPFQQKCLISPAVMWYRLPGVSTLLSCFLLSRINLVSQC